ncbi:hypothetical protein OG897_40725 [Streptomyces sp. NBC_00237]|nr:hypothetical protein [Streptomyces sp. NBC_00237]MCX5207710.1 hypothetical protein [Streptomyces sp. NBC_00237]
MRTRTVLPSRCRRVLVESVSEAAVAVVGADELRVRAWMMQREAGAL